MVVKFPYPQPSGGGRSLRSAFAVASAFRDLPLEVWKALTAQSRVVEENMRERSRWCRDHNGVLIPLAGAGAK